MTPCQYERLRELFHALCDSAPSEQAAALEELRGSDVGLKGDLAGLLELDSQRRTDDDDSCVTVADGRRAFFGSCCRTRTESASIALGRLFQFQQS